jgi:hypothetical protein
MILRVAVPAEAVAAGTGEGETRGINKHQIEPREQVAPVLEQPLFGEVLVATRRKRAGAVLLALGQRRAKPGHGAIEMVQFEPLAPGDPVILAPALGGAIRAAAHQPIQRRQIRQIARSRSNPCDVARPVPRSPPGSRSRSTTVQTPDPGQCGAPTPPAPVLRAPPPEPAPAWQTAPRSAASVRAGRSSPVRRAVPRSRSPAGAPARRCAGSRPGVDVGCTVAPTSR